MKKTYTFLMASLLLTAGASLSAQSQVSGNIDKTGNEVDFGKTFTNVPVKTTGENYDRAGDPTNWMNYAVSSANFIGGDNAIQIFPISYDSTLYNNSGGFHWYNHGVAATFDPASLVFQDEFNNGGDVMLFPNTNYDVDSISFIGFYNRGTAIPGGISGATVDTLIVQVGTVAPSQAVYYFTAIEDDGFKSIDYDVPNHGIDANVQTIKIPLDAAAFADSTQDGYHEFDIALPSTVSVAGASTNDPQAQREHLVVGMFFKPGYTQNMGDPLFDHSFFWAPFVRESEGNAPFYESYIENITQYLTSEVRYDDPGSSWQGLFIPNLAFVPGFLSESNLAVSYRVTAISNFDFVSTEINDVDEFKATQNYPNPAETNTYIKYSVSNNADVEVELTDLSGKVIKTINEGNKTAGEHIVNVNVSDLSAGTYIYTIKVNGTNAMTNRMTVK